jgi:hypothetical protein
MNHPPPPQKNNVLTVEKPKRISCVLVGIIEIVKKEINVCCKLQQN